MVHGADGRGLSVVYVCNSKLADGAKTAAMVTRWVVVGVVNVESDE